MEEPTKPVPDDISVYSSDEHPAAYDHTSSGAFCSVRLCKVHTAHLGPLSLVTFFHKGQTHLRDHPGVRRHLESVSVYRHPNVARVFSVDSQLGQTSLLMENPECGDFAAYVKSHIVMWSQVVDITRDVLAGLTFLEVSSRDVSCDVQISIGLANIWMFSGGVAKVACCGLSLVDQICNETTGLSPDEELPLPASDMADRDHGNRPCQRSDVYSFGMTLLAMMECLQGSEPSQASVYQNIQQRFANISSECPKELKHLVELCLGITPQEERTFSELYLLFQSLYPLKLFSVWDVSLHNAIVPKHQKWVVFKRQVYEVTQTTAAFEPSSDADLEARENLPPDLAYQDALDEFSAPVSYTCDCDMNSVDQLCDGNSTFCDSCDVQHSYGHPAPTLCNEHSYLEETHGNDQYKHSSIAQNSDHREFSSDNSMPMLLKEENDKLCEIRASCDDCVMQDDDIGVCLCEINTSPGASSPRSRSEDTEEDDLSESWQEVTPSQCGANDCGGNDNIRLSGLDVQPTESDRCSAQEESDPCSAQEESLSEVSRLEQCTGDNGNAICFSDEEDLINQPDTDEYRCENEFTKTREPVDDSSKGSENYRSYEDIGFISDDDTGFPTEGVQNVPKNEIGFTGNNNHSQNNKEKSAKNYLPDEEIHFIDDDSESNDIGSASYTNVGEKSENQHKDICCNLVSSDELSLSSGDECQDVRIDDDFIPHEQMVFLGDDDLCYQNGRTFSDQRLNTIGDECSCVHRSGGINRMADEDTRYYCDNDLSFQTEGSVNDEDSITADEIPLVNDHGFCDEENSLTSSQDAGHEDNGNDTSIQRNEIGFMSDDNLCVPNESCRKAGDITSCEETDAYKDSECDRSKHENVSEIRFLGDEEEGYKEAGNIDYEIVNFIYDDNRICHHSRSNLRSLSLVNTCQCLLLDNVLDVPHTAIQTPVSPTDFSTSSESNVVNIKGVKRTVGRRLGYMCDLSIAEYWLDIRQDLTMLLQDIEMKQHGISKLSTLMDFKDCLLRKLRDIDMERFEHKELSAELDINTRVFPIATEILSDPSRLRPWLNNWVPFDTSLPESGCAWKEMEYSGDFSDTSEVTYSPWYGEWKPFDMNIEGETAWPNLPDDVIANDVPTEQQLVVIQSRQKYKHRQTEDHMTKRRLNLGCYFMEKYGFESNIIDQYLGFVPRLKESDEKLKSLADMDFSFIIV